MFAAGYPGKMENDPAADGTVLHRSNGEPVIPPRCGQVGGGTGFKLINAPTYNETGNYWLLCARAIIHGKRMLHRRILAQSHSKCQRPDPV